jgi:nucleotide-binding universal stress UspA family protein
MKLLIAYDGSDCSNAALEDLKHAGLPFNTKALVLSVTENLTLILEEQQKVLPAEENFDYRDRETIKRMQERAQAAFTEAQELVKYASKQLQTDFPSWQIHREALSGFAHWSILEKSRDWKPDLIVVGTHGRNLIERVVLGSTSLKILSEAECSVRVTRRSPARTTDDDSPLRIIVGFDGSPDSMLAVNEIAKRAWRQESAVRLVTAVESVMTSNLEDDIKQAEELRGFAVNKLEAAGLHVSNVVREGDAKRILVAEAEKWGADAIFIGARGHRLIERVLLGSVSYAVAARAHCSVEVVRSK